MFKILVEEVTKNYFSYSRALIIFLGNAFYETKTENLTRSNTCKVLNLRCFLQDLTSILWWGEFHHIEL